MGIRYKKGNYFYYLCSGANLELYLFKSDLKICNNKRIRAETLEIAVGMGRSKKFIKKPQRISEEYQMKNAGIK